MTPGINHRAINRFVCAFLLTVCIFLSPLFLKAANITGVTPAANSHGVVASANISVTFDAAIPAAVVIAANFKVSGEQSGTIIGTFTGGGTNTITFDPTRNLKAGEVITVTLTPALGLTSAYTWRFIVATATGVPTFVSIPPVTTNATNAYSVYATDVDGDGDVDMLSSSIGNNTVAWYENVGSPAFTAHTIGTTTAPASLAATDLDDDGDMDVIATSNDITPHLIWYENTGAAAFTAHSIANTTSVDFVYAADIDGDGDKDIVSSGDNTVVLFINDGGENFAPQIITIAIEGRATAQAADVDRDGDLDILVACEGDPLLTGLKKIAWYENDHTTVFAEHIVALPQAAHAAYAADIDGDGDMDIVSSGSSDGNVDWYQNNGAQVFTLRSVVSNVADSESVYAADFDGDGDMDVLSSSIATKIIYWHENNGLGVFTATHQVGTAIDGAMTLYAADIDGDGDLDAMSASSNDNKITWFPNNLPPVIAGAVANQTMDDYSTLAPFSNITVTDRDATQRLAISVTLDLAAKGSFTAASLTASGFVNAGAGIYTFNGDAAAAQAAIRLLVFKPTTGRMPIGNSETVTLTIIANDAISPAVTNNITTIIVTAIAPPVVNNAPSFTKGRDIEVNENAPLQTFTAWATNISAGPVSESGQTLSFIVTNDNNALFEVQPAISANGTLTFKPAADAWGTATVTVVLRDNGGTAYGGVDQSPAVTFVITVRQGNDGAAFHAVFIPTLFSPNDDGSNDVFRVRAEDIADIRFCVYAADGQEVFRTTDINEATQTGWNGRYHGRDMPTGTYTWTIQGHFTDGAPLTSGKHRYGQVALVR